MRILRIKPYLTDDALKNEMNRQKKVDSFRDCQIIYCVQTNSGKKAEEIAKILGITKNKVFKTVERYNIRDVEQKLCAVVLNLLDDKEKVKSLTGFGWVLDAISDSLIAV